MEGGGGRIQCLLAARKAVPHRSVVMPGTVVLHPWRTGLSPQAVLTLCHMAGTAGARGKRGFGTLLPAQPGARGITELPER